METTLEFLTTRKPGREAHRHWPDEIKAKIVSESLRTLNQTPQRAIVQVFARYREIIACSEKRFRRTYGL
ncbi:hypothetical protein GGE48_006687 [Rhizobium leguminosarum]|nr:hypothetical protein [Rhizobium leguminosarum]